LKYIENKTKKLDLIENGICVIIPIFLIFLFVFPGTFENYRAFYYIHFPIEQDTFVENRSSFTDPYGNDRYNSLKKMVQSSNKIVHQKRHLMWSMSD